MAVLTSCKTPTFIVPGGQLPKRRTLVASHTKAKISSSYSAFLQGCCKDIRRQHLNVTSSKRIAPGRLPATRGNQLVTCELSSGSDEDAFVLGVLGASALAIFLIAGRPFVSIPAGNLATVDLYGNVQQYTIPQGVHLKPPFAATHPYSLKTQLIDVTQDVPTSEGLIVELDVSILYKVQPELVRSLYVTVGTNYEDVLVLPEVQSVVRSLTSQYSAKALYSQGRDELSQGMVNELNRKLGPRGITIEDALLRKVKLPEMVTRAIEGKLKAEQESEQMEYVLVKEQQEAERKRVEARGIADFQAIVSEGINEELLEWKGIEATELLAQSDNTKVVVIGSNKNGMPLILGDGSNAAASTNAPTIASSKTKSAPAPAAELNLDKITTDKE
mmetsp:Transcript_23795/g.28715  ORF Transcript_23795/g.28715 Transcript_23795/m.28715 type:complete len:388 (+) Transcript_23795:117-1280(+)|eukprot:CAMPEP_0197847074 /NCGR_PEP_ID=MMETSP1438-20131217/5185_1 /TAXON_ID=1461541 /ORGANISM="Pterosperma sp., Strain CCMP1384" /LENGTH=387 /DNA_ID=CAMNT_0043458891 /DNA_START=116 /DNA_END=1279 /DNA_ORIENTATION=+